MSQASSEKSAVSSRDEREIASFAAQAGSWWDPTGPFAPLHALNPTRIRIITDMISQHFGRTLDNPGPFSGLKLTDVGCGGGLVTEPFARLEFEVLGLDAAEENVQAAQAHAMESGLNIDYRVGSPDEPIAQKDRSDVVLALEVIEHVADIDAFVSGLADRLAPGGLLVMSTINRTPKSFVLAKAMAEYVLRWVPPGTHQWRKFVRPSELAQRLRAYGFRTSAIQGMEYDSATGEWFQSDDIAVNYLLSATRE